LSVFVRLVFALRFVIPDGKQVASVVHELESDSFSIAPRNRLPASELELPKIVPVDRNDGTTVDVVLSVPAAVRDAYPPSKTTLDETPVRTPVLESNLPKMTF
jgi:hypothetical protein